VICDNFLTSFDLLHDASINTPFLDEVNPVDGVIYPQICKEIPQEVEQEIVDNIEKGCLLMHRAAGQRRSGNYHKSLFIPGNPKGN